MDAFVSELDGVVVLASSRKIARSREALAICEVARGEPGSVVSPSILIKGSGVYEGANVDLASLKASLRPLQKKDSLREIPCPVGSLMAMGKKTYERIGGNFLFEGWGCSSVMSVGLRVWLTGGRCLSFAETRIGVDSDPVAKIEDSLSEVANKIIICQMILPLKARKAASEKLTASVSPDTMISASKILCSRMDEAMSLKMALGDSLDDSLIERMMV
jgi:hypothetical protein